MVLVIFWAFVLLISYFYFGYPLILFVLGFLGKNKKGGKKDKLEYNYPAVSLIISAYNEEKIIEKKIENSLELNYPKDKLEIIVVSDGSTDNTDGIVKRYSSKFDNIKLIRVEGRRGKNIALNKALSSVSGDIIVFSDTDWTYQKNAIRNLVKYFSKKEVGCVVGELRYINTENSNVGQGESLYWKYESFIKKLESRLGSLLFASGTIFATRRDLYFTLEPDVPNDLQIPIKIGSKGYEVIYEPEAIAIGKAVRSSKEEFKRKIRTINRGLACLLEFHREIKGLRLFEFVSHKVLRWMASIFLILIFLLNIFLIDFNFYGIIFLLQLIFYGLAGVGAYFQWKKIQCGIFYAPFYFCLVNLTAFVALFEFLLGKRYPVWEKASTTR